MQKITPFLWLDGKVEEAITFYTSIFSDAKILNINRVGDSVMSATFQLEGQEFMALNGGPMFQFSPAISFFVRCETQVEVDYFWEKLTDGGEPQRCGWLKDKFGLSWQIIPSVLGKLLGDSNPEKSKNVMNAMLQMNKIEIKALQDA